MCAAPFERDVHALARAIAAALRPAGIVGGAWSS